MVGLTQLRSVPMAAWPTTLVAAVLDPSAPAISADHSAADAEAALRQGPWDYVPVIDAPSHRLVGIVSDSDVYRALGEPRDEGR
jgi:CBS domain-containing protein